MRSFMISLAAAAAASAFAVASPASAQVTGQHYGYPGYGAPGYGAPGYGAPGYGVPGYGVPGYGVPSYGAPGYGYGYGYGHGQVRALQARVDGLQRQIRVLDRRNILSNREARLLRQQSLAVEHRLIHADRHGLNPWEAQDIQTRIARLEYRVHREAIDRNGRWGGGYGQRYGDHQWQDQHGRWHDRHD